MNEYNEDSSFNLTTYCLKSRAENKPEAIALLVVNSIGEHERISYQLLYQKIAQITSGLIALNLPRHSTVAIHTFDPLDTVLLFFACIAANLVALPLLYSLTQEEIEYILENANCQLMITQSETLQINAKFKMIKSEGLNQLKKSPHQPINPSTMFNDPAYIFYTSGSTGKPKGVLHAQHVILGRCASIENWLPINPNDIVMQTDNICWTYSMASGVLDPLLMGATALLYVPINKAAKTSDRVSGQVWLDIIRYYHVTIMAATPDTYISILTVPNINKDQIPTLQYAGSAGASLADNVIEEWRNIFGFPIYTALGMSELSTFISTGLNSPPRTGKVGRIQPGRKVRILPLASTLEEVPIDAVGLLGIHQSEYGFMLGYVGMTDTEKFRDGWFVTSDLVSMDKDGYITYFGRNDIVLKVDGGYRVSPVEIENVLKTCPHVIDALCKSEETTSESASLAVYIVLDVKYDDENIKTIYNMLVQHLSDYKIPDVVHVVSNLQHNARGKIIREQQLDILYSFPKK